MPSKSAKQHRFMEAVAHGMKPRGGKGPSARVAKEFVAADKAIAYSVKRKASGKKK